MSLPHQLRHTPAECAACSVLVECLRRGWWYRHGGPDVPTRVRCEIIAEQGVYHGRSPAEVWERAMEGEG